MTSPDLISRGSTATAPGQPFIDDITYLRTGADWLYRPSATEHPAKHKPNSGQRQPLQ